MKFIDENTGKAFWMPGYIKWNGVDMRTIAGGNIWVEHYPKRTHPERKVDTESVPGKNGDILFMQDAWENVEQEYEIVAGDGQEGATPAAFREIAEWLYAPSGYQLLQDTYEPGYFRRAYFKGPFDVEDLLWRYGRATITFVCRPELFKIEGEEQKTFARTATFTARNTTGDYTVNADYYPGNGSDPDYGVTDVYINSNDNLVIKLNNPTKFNSRPYFYLYGRSMPTMLDMSNRTVVNSYVPEKPPTSTDNFFPYLDNPCIYVGLTSANPSEHNFKIDGTKFSRCEIVSDGNVDATQLNATHGVSGTDFIGMNIPVSPNTRYGVSWDSTESSIAVGVITFTARGKHIKTKHASGSNTYFNFSTGGSDAYAVITFQFAGANRSASINHVQVQIVNGSDSDPEVDVSYSPPVRDDANNAIIKIENGSTGVTTIMTIDNLTDFMRVDCDTMNVYRTNRQNRNSDVFIDTLEFPVLTPGENIITLRRLQGLGMRPRWWTL